MSLRVQIGAATDVGRVRDHNEDDYLVDEGLGLIAVADGMGGHRGGEVASAAALEALRIAFVAGTPIQDAIGVANDAVYEQSVADPNLRGMGTTLTAGTFDEDGNLVFGHVGDSRAYLARDGALERITTDHSLVEELVRAGELTPEEAERDPRRSMITRALGLEPGVEVDVVEVTLVAGDRLLLCSDGLTTMLHEDEIATVLADEADPTAAAHRLIAGANDAGGSDNITVVIMDAHDADTATAEVAAGTDTNADVGADADAGERTEAVAVVVDDETAAADPEPEPEPDGDDASGRRWFRRRR